MIKLQDLKDVFGNHPIFKEIERSKADALLDERKNAAATIKALEAERSHRLKELREALQEKQASYEEARKICTGLEVECRQAKAILDGESHGFERQISKQVDILLDSYDPAITEALESFNKKLQWLRSPGRINYIPFSIEKNPANLTKNVVELTNRQAILNALTYCQFAIQALEKAKLSPSIDTTWIESLKAGIPSIENYDEISTEKPMEKGVFSPPKITDYELLQMDRSLDELNEKLTRLHIAERIKNYDKKVNEDYNKRTKRA